MGQKAIWKGADTQYIAANLEGTFSYLLAAACSLHGSPGMKLPYATMTAVP